jgi:hypothetical protein
MTLFELFRKLLKTELLLAIIFFMIPIVLPLTSSGDLLDSVSAYAYADNFGIYNLLLVLTSYFIIIDGAIDATRRYNVVLGLFLLLVALFPVLEWRWTHDLFAVLFFIGNTYIVTHYTKILPRLTKNIFKVIIGVGVVLFMLGHITLFVTEAVGFFVISFYMFARFKIEWDK